MKTYTGKQLQFISQIKRDGSGVVDLAKDIVALDSLDNVTLNLHVLSLTEGTYIAFSLNAYVVKLKPNEKN